MCIFKIIEDLLNRYMDISINEGWLSLVNFIEKVLGIFLLFLKVYFKDYKND